MPAIHSSIRGRLTAGAGSILVFIGTTAAAVALAPPASASPPSKTSTFIKTYYPHIHQLNLQRQLNESVKMHGGLTEIDIDMLAQKEQVAYQWALIDKIDRYRAKPISGAEAASIAASGGLVVIGGGYVGAAAGGAVPWPADGIDAIESLVESATRKTQ